MSSEKHHIILGRNFLQCSSKTLYPSKLMSTFNILPGDFRNDLYLTLCKGEFEKGSKTAGKNIEVHVIVIDKESQIVQVKRIAPNFLNILSILVILFVNRYFTIVFIFLQNCISIGSGEPEQSHFKSLVFRHANNPKWNETLKVKTNK